ADRNRSHWSTSKTPSYTKSVSWQHHPLTGDIGLDGADIGKIAVHPAHVYVAVRQAVAHKAWKQLQGGKIKGKTCRVRLLK
ncbi:DbpA RNA binding domain-containing protein, partial [Escherichia coli]|uniref:DbpA RNA binding domain-containing protein n=1 Tax=Escherichia coli TaxID=562 RepID=UPI0020B1EB63